MLHKPIPPELLDSLRGLKEFSVDSFCKAHGPGEAVNSIRINPDKMNMPVAPNDSGAREILKKWQDEFEQVPWCPWGRYLPQRPSYIHDPFWHAGAYYVQEASSMFLYHGLNTIFPDRHKKMRILDLCAAPGGKSSLLATYFREQLIVANEIIGSRINVLAENLCKWGCANALVTQNDARDFSKLSGFFNLIVVDAPCSGSGLFRKDESAIHAWSPAQVKHCSLRQQRILSDILPALEDEGILMYSTCSFSKEENEDILDWLLGEMEMESVAVPAPAEWGVVETSSDRHGATGYRFYPDHLRGEGFFMACLKKKKAEKFYPVHRGHSLDLLTKDTGFLNEWIKEKERWSYIRKERFLLAIPAAILPDYRNIFKVLKIRKGGVLLGKWAGNDLIPDHELALSELISPQIPFLSFNITESLQFLRREELDIHTHLKGWALVKYGGMNLGWVKILPNRVNNYFPPALRVMKG